MTIAHADSYNIHEAKTHFSQIIARVEHGDQVFISRAGVPVAMVVPLPPSLPRKGRGALRGAITWAEDWDDQTVNAQIAESFGTSA